MEALKKREFKVIALAPKDKTSEKLARRLFFVPLRYLSRKGKNPLQELWLLAEYFQ